MHRSEVAGQLSGAFASLDENAREAALRGLNELPEQVGLLSLRTLVPVMALLDIGQPLNQLSAEAIAACVVLEAGLLVTTDSPKLRAGAERLHSSNPTTSASTTIQRSPRRPAVLGRATEVIEMRARLETIGHGERDRSPGRNLEVDVGLGL